MERSAGKKQSSIPIGYCSALLLEEEEAEHMKHYSDLSNQAVRNEAAPLSQQKPSELSGTEDRGAQGTLVQGRNPDGPRAFKEKHINMQEAEAMFRFGDFLWGLASELLSCRPEEKCLLCVYGGDTECGDPFPACYTGIRTFLFQRATVYREEMDKCCKAYFTYLDSVHDKKGMNSYMAEDALKVEYPWLSDHPEYAKYAIALWMLNHAE